MTAPGMEGLRDALAEEMRVAEHGEGALEEYLTMADAILAPGGPLWPALRALGLQAWANADDILIARYSGNPVRPDVDRLNASRRALAIGTLGAQEITGPLASACLAAAEMEAS